MAYSWQEETMAAGTTVITCELAYLDKSYIYVYLDGTLLESTEYTWTSDTSIQLNTALTASTVVLLVRRTSKDYLYIVFGTGASFIVENLDTQNTQFLHLAQELVEGRSIDGFYGDLSMNGFRITDLGTPVDDGDAVNKEYVDDTQAVQDARLDTLENVFLTGGTTATTSFKTQITTATDTVTTGVVNADKAIVFLNGLYQELGTAVTVSAGVLTFAETLPVGSRVYALMGENIAPDDGVATSAQMAAALARIQTLEATAAGLGTLSTQNANAVAITGGSIAGITDLAVVDGGTGASTAAGARTNLGLGTMSTQAASAVAITGGSIAGITDLAVADGGTGASTAAAARTSLGAAASGDNTDITSLAGTTAGTDAATGKIGEILTATASSVAVAASATAYTIVTLTLTPGDWEVDGHLQFNNSSVSVTNVRAGLSATAAALAGAPYETVLNVAFTAGSTNMVNTPSRRISVSVNTTIYLVGYFTFASGSVTAAATIRARRAR